MKEYSPGGSDGKESASNAGDQGSIPGSGRSSGEGNGNPLQYSGLESSMDSGAWQATVHEVAKNRTQLSKHTHTQEHPKNEISEINLSKEMKYLYTENHTSLK